MYLYKSDLDFSYFLSSCDKECYTFGIAKKMYLTKHMLNQLCTNFDNISIDPSYR